MWPSNHYVALILYLLAFRKKLAQDIGDLNARLNENGGEITTNEYIEQAEYFYALPNSIEYLQVGINLILTCKYSIELGSA